MRDLKKLILICVCCLLVFHEIRFFSHGDSVLSTLLSTSDETMISESSSLTDTMTTGIGIKNQQEMQNYVPIKVTKMEDLLNLNMTIDIPTNLHIVMMGDSLTRYQYLSLVYFLSKGKWIANEDRPNLLLEKTHDSWYDFYSFTNNILQPYELCDCFRGESKQYHGAVITNTVENRYFYDPERNNSVVYLQKFGSSQTFHSDWNVNEIEKLQANHPNQFLDSKELNYVFDSKNWSDIIDNYVCQLKPKPSVFLLNEGFWAVADLEDASTRKEIIDSLKRCGIQSMYKTTTKPKRDNSTDIREYERDLCQMSDYCFDMSWTGMIPSDMYEDEAHFIPMPYNWFNILLLDMLKGTSVS